MRQGKWLSFRTTCIIRLGIAAAICLTEAQAQSSQNQTPQPATPQFPQNIPDAPSAVQPPPKVPAQSAPNQAAKQPSYRNNSAEAQDQTAPASRRMRTVGTIPSQTPAPAHSQPRPKNQINPREDLYKILVTTNFVQVPVMVKNREGQRVDGLLPTDFTVRENGEPQTLAFFTSDPFQLSVAIVLDLGMADVAVQKVNQTYGTLAGAFSPYDEFALYTYSSTVSQVTGYTSHVERLIATLDSMKPIRGRNNGPPILGGPLGPQPAMINGFQVGSSLPPPVGTPPKETHVLNDAILCAAVDLSSRDRTHRKVVLVISDGRERGSQANYRQVVKVLQSYGIQVNAVVLDQGALPVYKQAAKIHNVLWGYAAILPRYTHATGGASVFASLSRDSIEKAYSEITSEARNQYTLGYIPNAVKSSMSYRSIEVTVDRKNLRVYAKAGYYPPPPSN